MSDKLHICSTVREYDGQYRCMECFQKFAICEDDMNDGSYSVLAAAKARIAELEQQVQDLQAALARIQRITTDQKSVKRNPDKIHVSRQHNFRNRFRRVCFRRCQERICYRSFRQRFYRAIQSIFRAGLCDLRGYP